MHSHLPNSLGPWPYYIDHLIIAAGLGVVAFLVFRGRIGPGVGAVFYGVREVVQALDYGYFDWPGFLWPVMPMVLAEMILQRWRRQARGATPRAVVLRDRPYRLPPGR